MESTMDYSGYRTFARICVVDPKTRKLAEPRRFQIFKCDREGKLEIVDSAPIGAEILHSDLPVSYRDEFMLP